MKIFLVGDPLLVAEYAGECASHGHAVAVRLDGSVTPNPPLNVKNVAMVKSPPKTTTLAVELTNCSTDQKRINLRQIDAVLDPSVPVLCSAITVTATECAQWIQKSRVLIGVSAFPSLLGNKLVELSVPAHRTDEGVEDMKAFFQSLGKESAVIDDRIGMVLPRILAQVINEAILASSQQLAPPQALDAAMKLGADYPRGPLEWLDAISAPQVVAVLDALRHDTGDERYSAAPLLRKMANAGEFWK